jgi:Flp pilus assembly pilin Flp
MEQYQAKRKAPSGQGLVEYALILVLVALIAIPIVYLIGLGVSRVYGVVGGALGFVHNDHRQHYIDISQPALCIASTSQNLTGLWVTGDTDETLSNLTGSTNLAVGTGLNGAPFAIQSNSVPSGAPGGAVGFKFNPLLANGVSLAVCPVSVVIQAQDGTEAFAPVTAQTGP